MDAVVIGSITAVGLTIVVFVGFLWYWISKIIKHPTSHD